jgi:hypothetical protein
VDAVSLLALGGQVHTQLEEMRVRVRDFVGGEVNLRVFEELRDEEPRERVVFAVEDYGGLIGLVGVLVDFDSVCLA